MDNDFKVPDTGIIFGHQPCQTRDAKWICLENIYQKFHRPNLYDIGGTYEEDRADFWFYYKTEIVGKIFLLHLFVTSREQYDMFNISVNNSNEITFKRKHNIAYLSSSLKTFKFCGPESTMRYIKSYSFSEIEVDLFKNMKLYISISFEDIPSYTCASFDTVMKHNFGALLEDPVCSDFTIESADGKKFHVHRILLTTHSDVFKAMMKETTAESINSYLKMVDVNEDDLKHILEFIYTGTIKDLESTSFFNLLMLADKYNLKGLKELSEHILTSQLNLDNVIETLAMADLYRLEKLKIAAMSFIKCNQLVIHNTMFEELNNVELMRELCQFLVPL